MSSDNFLSFVSEEFTQYPHFIGRQSDLIRRTIHYKTRTLRRACHIGSRQCGAGSLLLLSKSRMPNPNGWHSLDFRNSQPQIR
jgi:hypothetical protein